ncbi:MAG: hypothetical protein ABIP30_11070 [Ferruginibacter sp.]
MKHTFKKTRNITVGLSVLFLMAATQAVFAAPATDNPTEVKFLGKVKSQPLFQLDVNNNENETFVIVIKNNVGNEIYSEKVSGANLSRKYRLEISEDELNASDFGLTFEVTSVKTKHTESYKVSQKTQYIQGFEVAKL